MLPHGSIARIAEIAGIRPDRVSQIFNYGWHPHLRSQVIGAALDILDEINLGDDDIKRAKGYGLNTTNPGFVPIKPKRKRVQEPAVPRWGDDPKGEWKELKARDWDDLCDLTDELRLPVDPDDYPVGLFTTLEEREDDFRKAIFRVFYPHG